MDSTFSSTHIAAQLEKIRQIQQQYRHATNYGTRSDGYDADVSDDGLADHRSEDMTDDIHDDTCDNVDEEPEGVGSRKCGDAHSDGPSWPGNGHCMSDTESDDESRALDSSSEGSVSDCGDSEMDVMEDGVYSEYLKDIQEEYRALASIDPHGYEPLRHERREIRLLFIMPREFRLATDRELVSCFTVVQQFDNAEAFTGLSYVWGDEKDTLPIILNNKVVQVTRNLATALRHIEHDRGRWGVRVFWIDALCINQKNNSEKSHQVQMMGDIYRRATRVFAWLDRATRQTIPTFKWIRKSVARVTSRYERNNPGRVFRHDISDYGWLMLSQSPPPFSDVYRTFKTKVVRPRQVRLLNEFIGLCRHPYWQRIWILQEISSYSSVKIHLGCNSLDLRYADLFCRITNAAFWWHDRLFEAGLISTSPLHIWSMSHAVKPLRAISIVRRAIERQCLFFMLVNTMEAHPSDPTPHFQSTKPEDRIFALLGLAGDAPDLGLTPDYSKRVKEIYTETASSILRLHGELSLLSFSQVPKLIEGLPSWAPDWSMVLPAWPFYRHFDRPEESGACLMQTSQNPRVDGNNLILTGVPVDTVYSTLSNQNTQCRFWFDDAAVREIEEFMMSAVEFIKHHIFNPTRSYANKMNTLEALYHVCLPDASLRPRIFEGNYGFAEFLWDYEVSIGVQYARPIPDFIHAISRRIQSHYHFERRIFATTRGFIGLGPAHVQEGDVVVIFHGGKIPFLLRPVKDGRQGHYELMGEACMYGMMEGQFMWTNPPTQEFTLV